MRHPKVIHRVWLGPNEPARFYEGLGDVWASMYPGWVVIDWNDDLVERRLPMRLQREYDEAPTYVHRADIVAVEAVRVFGGMFVGWDMEPLQPIVAEIETSDGWCTPDADGIPGGGLFGAVPNHPALKDLLDVIRERIARDGWREPNESTGPLAWADAFGEPGFYGRALHSLDVLGTTAWAYPIHYSERELLADRDRAREVARERGAYALHYFAQSWLEGGLDVRVRGAEERS